MRESNDNGSEILPTGTTAAVNTIAISGTNTATLVTPTGGAAGKPLADAASQTIRAGLVSQYNNIIQQITTTSQDASFNGINLLNGDNLKLTFNETGKSTLNIFGVTFNATGLGLAALTTRERGPQRRAWPPGQSIAVSALALPTQSQQGAHKLLK